jgi:hypothetical protein
MALLILRLIYLLTYGAEPFLRNRQLCSPSRITIAYYCDFYTYPVFVFKHFLHECLEHKVELSQCLTN